MTARRGIASLRGSLQFYVKGEGWISPCSRNDREMRLVGFDEDCVDEELVGFLAGGCDDVVVAVFAGLDFRAHGDGLAPVYPDEGDDFAEGGSVVAGFDVGLFAFGGTEVVRVDLADVLVGGRVGEGKSRGERGYREKQDRDEESHVEKFRGRAGKSN